MSKSRLWSWALVAAGFWTAGFIYNVYIGGYPSWLRTMYNRKAALAQEIEEPKVIIAGGSGAHYTINSDVMVAELGMPVMNLGSNGGVGLNVLLPSVIEDVKPGDIMLLIPEYPLLVDDDGVDDLSATFSFMIGQPGVGNIPVKDLVQNAMNLGIPSLNALVKTGKDIVQEGRFDYYGDPLTQRGDATIEIPRQSEWWPMTIGKPISDYSLQRLEQFKAEVEARGGTLVLSLPWIYAKTEGKTVENIEATAEALADIAPTLYDPETLNIQGSPDLFADTHYHLKIPARVVRSQQLADELKATLPRFSATGSEAN
jgi:hypothetical protein